MFSLTFLYNYGGIKSVYTVRKRMEDSMVELKENLKVLGFVAENGKDNIYIKNYILLKLNIMKIHLKNLKLIMEQKFYAIVKLLVIFIKKKVWLF